MDHTDEKSDKGGESVSTPEYLEILAKVKNNAESIEFLLENTAAEYGDPTCALGSLSSADLMAELKRRSSNLRQKLLDSQVCSSMCMV